MRNPVSPIVCLALVTALSAQEAQKSEPARSIPALEIAQQRMFLETALMSAASKGGLRPGDFGIDVEAGPGTEGPPQMIAKIEFRGGRDAPTFDRRFPHAVVHNVEADRDRGWHIAALDVRFEERDAESDTPATVRSLVFFRGSGSATPADGARALAAVESTVSAAGLTDVRLRPIRLLLTRTARKDRPIRLLRVEFALLGESFRAGFAAIATAFEAAAKDPESPFAAVRSRGRERVLTKESGASYELEIELRTPDAERGR